MFFTLIILVAISSGVMSLFAPTYKSHPFKVSGVAAVVMSVGLYWILPGVGWVNEELPVFILSVIAIVLSQLSGLDFTGDSIVAPRRR
jgi:hypothetical protein